MKMYLYLLPFLFLLACNSGPEIEELKKLAQEGKINYSAPVKADVTAMLKVPAAVVWHRLTNMQEWPKWNSQVSEVNVRGRLQSGRTFTWISNDTEIASEIVTYKEGKTVIWVGEASGVKAIHLWKVEVVDEFSCIIISKESLDGFMLDYFYSSEELQKSLDLWLNDLKKSFGESSLVDY